MTTRKLNKIAFMGSIYFTIFLQFLVFRFLYIVDHRAAWIHSENAISEIFHAWFLACRTDFLLTSVLTLPIFLAILILVGLKKEKNYLKLHKSIFGILLSFNAFVLLIDHFFYVFFKNHLNGYFFEAFENFENTDLALNSIKDVGSPLKLILSISFVFLLNILYIKFQEKLYHFLKSFLNLSKILNVVIVVLYLFSFRSTFLGRPLSMQVHELTVSKNSFINLLATNVYLPLYNNYSYMAVDQTQKSRHNFYRNQDLQYYQSYFSQLQSFFPNHEIIQEKNSIAFKTQVLPTWSTYFTKKPKHIVLVVMESYSDWPSKYEGNHLNLEIASEMLKLKKQSYFFENHFTAHGGTIKNIISIIYSFTSDRNFAPSLNYLKESLHDFPDVLSKQPIKFNFESLFFYGGSPYWHNLENFALQNKFTKFFGRQSFNDYKQNKYGLYDEDLFDAVLKTVKNEKNNTFSFVMSMSNHPPYYIPESFPAKELVLSEDLEKRIASDKANVQERLNAFRYADYSLGKMIENAKNDPYFDDVLFVLTGDHPFGGGFHYSSEDTFTKEKIPLLFYAPKIMKTEFIGKSNQLFTSHLDLNPTLTSLMIDEPIQMTTWGDNILNEQLQRELLISYDFTCKKTVCLDQQNKLFKIIEGSQKAEYLEEKEYEEHKINELQELYRGFYETQTGYFFRHKGQ